MHVFKNETILGFLKDLLELVKSDYNATKRKNQEDFIMKGCDFIRYGKKSIGIRKSCCALYAIVDKAIKLKIVYLVG